MTALWTAARPLHTNHHCMMQTNAVEEEVVGVVVVVASLINSINDNFLLHKQKWENKSIPFARVMIMILNTHLCVCVYVCGGRYGYVCVCEGKPRANETERYQGISSR